MMSDYTKVTASHRSRQAVVYVRQSTLTQLERNTESTARQYDLRQRAVALGWSAEQVRVIDVDLGVSGSVLGQRTGFETLVADADGVYHPGLFNDRLVLGMKGMLSEAELHVLRARLTGGIRNKAARGQLRTGLPVGLVWDETDRQIRLHPDEAVTGVIAAVF